MPRIYACNSDPVDFCHHCFPFVSEAEETYNDVGFLGEGPDDRGNCYDYKADHPAYAATGYTCEECGELLGDADD